MKLPVRGSEEKFFTVLSILLTRKQAINREIQSRLGGGYTLLYEKRSAVRYQTQFSPPAGVTTAALPCLLK